MSVNALAQTPLRTRDPMSRVLTELFDAVAARPLEGKLAD